MTWHFCGTDILEIPENAIGFVYIIVNKVSNKKYIGKKLFSFSKITYKTVKLKNGTKKRKKIKGKVESDWKEYWSSSEELKKDIETLGKENFSREILKFCNSKNELSYYEAKFQFDYNVLTENETNWYNKWISIKVRRFSPSGTT